MTGPLRGIRIIDITHEWAGPHAGRLMADFGAEVIKVEYFRRLDLMRGGRKDNRIFDRHARFLQLNRNKRSVALDLGDPGDKSVFEALVRHCDVVLSNSRPGVLERLGLGYRDLVKLKPGIILVSLSGYGQTGPEAAYSGYGGGLEATSGVQSLTAYSRTSNPRRIRELDVTNGIGGAAALLTALAERRRGSRGVWVDLSEIELASHVLAGEQIMEYAANGVSSLPAGNRHPVHAPYGCYKCNGEDAWIAIAVRTHAEWTGLCEVVGRPMWIGARRFATSAGRAEHHDEIDRTITEWTATRTKFIAMTELQKSGVPAGAVMNAADLHADPHLAARGYFRRPAEAPAAPPYSGFPFRLSRGGGYVARPGPPLGGSGHDIICKLLGRPGNAVRSLTLADIGTDFDLDAEE
jgi:crotonobetainyl-CoA:carnitine CoA-transferase CaiB-like acyl-CoA transferase